MEWSRNIRWSWLALFLVATAIIYVRAISPVYNVLSWDVLGYYFYLPAIFIYNDLGIKDISLYQGIIEQYNASDTLYQIIMLPDGTHLFRYSMGLAILYLPFFLVGHIIALLTTYAADGFTLPYQLSMIYGALLYTLMGLWLLRKVLRKFFNEGITALSLIIVVLGTNYIQITTIDGLMSHNFLFTLYALVIWLTMKWHEQPGFWRSAFLGLAMGVMTLSRPSEVVVVFIPLLWNIYNKESYRRKLTFIRQHWKYFVFVIAFFILGGLPQVIYWKFHTGSFIFYSYGNPGEGFEFLWPYTLKVLFSFRKGWLVYTPAMIFALAGFIIMWRKKERAFLALLVYFLLNLWFVSSWSVWYYADSFSQRALVQSYPVMAIALGFFLKYLNEKKNWSKWAVGILIFFCIGLNIFQAWQYTHGVLDGSRMTREYYFRIFGKTSVDEEDKELLLIERGPADKEKMPEDLEGYRNLLLGEDSFEEVNPEFSKHYVERPVRTGDYAFRLDSNKRFSPSIKAAYDDITPGYYAWIRASIWIYPVLDSSRGPYHLVVTFTNRKGAYKYRTVGSGTAKLDIIPGKWNKLEMEYLTPEVRRSSDMLNVYLWLQGEGVIYCDDLRVEAFVPLEE